MTGDEEDADGPPLSERTRSDLAAALHAHLAATEQSPIDPTTNRWLAEAEAVAADVADGSAPPEAIAKRAGQTERLLERAGDVDHPEAARHVDAALAIARELGGRGPAEN